MNDGNKDDSYCQNVSACMISYCPIFFYIVLFFIVAMEVLILRAL